MWALGCVLYTLLCGFPPFYDESIHTLTEKVARGQYTFLSPWWDDVSKSAKDLISHLLTVDPVQRYTIDEFLHHPWIRESEEETTPAFDAPPTTLKLKTDFIEPMEGVEETGIVIETPVHIRSAMQAGTTPLTPGARVSEFRSPGNISLREVFDVSYAVHRMEEERAFYGKGRGFGILNALDEDEEEALETVTEADESDDDSSSVEESPPEKKKPSVLSHVIEGQPSTVQSDMRGTTTSKDYQHRRRKLPAGAGKAPTKQGGGFELNLEGATLLSRRGKGMDAKTGVRSDGVARAALKALKVES
jgi:serine/threonine-protein kinase RCK2